MNTLLVSLLIVTSSASPSTSFGRLTGSVAVGLSDPKKEASIGNPKKDLNSSKHTDLKRHDHNKSKLALIETDDDVLPLKGSSEVNADIDGMADGADTQSNSGASSSAQTFAKLSAAIAGAQPSSSSNTPESRASTMKSMESTIMNLLLGKSAFGATPMGGSVKKIVNILTNEMKPKVKDAHKADQEQLFKLMRELKKCFSVRDSSIQSAAPWNLKYKKESKFHKECRLDEAVKFSEKQACKKQQYSLYQVKVLKCKYFATLSERYGSTTNNAAIVTKAGSETVQSYIARLSGTICGKHVHGEKGRISKPGGWGGGLSMGFYDQYLRAKHACETATKNYKEKVKECEMKISMYNERKGKCNQFQTNMDSQSCKHAVLMKDTCEQYAACYFTRLKAFKIARAKVKMEERDRKAEWRGLSRIGCLISAFGDGSVTDKEVDACKAMVVSTDLLIIKYPKVPPMTKCVVTKLYPSTGAYKRKEFGPLPMLAKGKLSVPCSGVEEIPTKPAAGSPKTCKCRRVTLEGHYKAGPIVKCTNCHDVRRSKDKSSCPLGTKIFSPSTRSDWQTLLGSIKPLAAPNWIVDITRPQNGCGGCTSNAMNSHNKNQKSWKTADGSPWWLRSTKYGMPAGDYSANCYLNLGKKLPADENSVTFSDKGGCNYHSKSYYCQKKRIYVKPRKGSPDSCKCQPLTLAEPYSTKLLVKCEQCLDVYRSQQKNSCPVGMKIFSPRSRADWKTFIMSAQPLRAPHFIIDVTRPQNGCGGCTRFPMNSKEPNQATWRTSDGSAWWLRSSKYTQPNGPAERPYGDEGPNGDYMANCFMDLWRRFPNENEVQFNDRKCDYHSRSYYCQPVYKKPPPPTPPPPMPPRRLVPKSMLVRGINEEVYYFKQGRKVPTDRMRRSTSDFRRVKSIQYKPAAKKAWPGFSRMRNFAVRWTGILIFPTHGKCSFMLKSDDGSIMWLNKKKLIDNDGIHALREKMAEVKELVRGQHHVRIEYFSGLAVKDDPKAGKKGFNQGPATFFFRWKFGKMKKFLPVTRKHMFYFKPSGFREEIFYNIKGMRRIPNLNKKRANVQRLIHFPKYPNTNAKWKGFASSENFAVRWSGFLKIEKGGTYRFSLKSDDGSRMFLGKRMRINNDGLHGLRQVESTMNLKDKEYKVTVEYFERGGHAGMFFRYMGPDTEDKMKYVGDDKHRKVPLMSATQRHIKTPKILNTTNVTTAKVF